jgi:hypothetical protein
MLKFKSRLITAEARLTLTIGRTVLRWSSHGRQPVRGWGTVLMRDQMV